MSTLTEDLLAASKANRALLLHLIQAEIERSVARLGLVSAHELDAAARRAKGLERRVAELEEELRRSSTARKAANTRAKKATAKKPAKKSTAKKSTAKKSAARRPRRRRRRDERRPTAADARTATPTSRRPRRPSDASAPTTHDRRVRHVTEQHHEDEVDRRATTTTRSTSRPAADEPVDQTDATEPTTMAARPMPATRGSRAAVARLDALGDRPPVEHVEVYEEVHRVLQESLADATHSTDRADGQPGGSQP